MAGRPPTPTDVKEVIGTIRPDRVRENEPKPEPGEVVKPKVLKGRASEIWDQYAPGLITMGTLTWVDAYTMGEWCQLTAQWEREGSKMKGNLRTARKSLGWDLGIGASGRAKLGTKRKKEDPADEFFNATG